MGIQVIKNEGEWGLYVWKMNNGKTFSDGNGNVMNIPGRAFDIEKMNRLRDAARYYGAPDGDVKFIAGVQRVSEMRHSEEIGRMSEGYIASESDIGAWQDAQHAYNEARRKGVDYDQGF